MASFSDRTALVTGVLTGIGRATALALATGGANLVVSGRHVEVDTEGTPGPLTGQTEAGYAATFDTSVPGTLLSLKHELRVMQAQGSGSIVNLSSTMEGNTEAGDQTLLAAAAIRRGVGRPVITAGMFDGPGAGVIVGNGGADLVAFGRHFIADPDLPDARYAPLGSAV